jgi:hypothetical protein
MRAKAALTIFCWLLAAPCLCANHAGAAAIANAPDARATSPVVTVNGTAPGQTGYVHFFIVRATGGAEWETQVGVEMPDQRIAWSFFELGVVVSQFMESGVMPANRKQIEFQYLYGVRPFPDDVAMRTLSSELEARVLPYAEAETPYCTVRGPSDAPCLSCLSFVMRVLFPGATPDDTRAQRTIYNTDDLLLYLTGLHGLRDREARLKRIDALALPADVREDVVRLVNTIDIPGAANTAANAAKTPARGRRLAKPTQRTQQLPKS